MHGQPCTCSNQPGRRSSKSRDRHHLADELRSPLDKPACIESHSCEGDAAPEYPLSTDTSPHDRLLRRGLALETATLAWNIAGIVVLAFAAIAARSVALAGFGLDSLIEIGASTVVIWELSGTGEERQRRAMRAIGGLFVALATYLAVQSTLVLVVGFHPRHSPAGIAWTAATAVVMFALAAGKARTGKALDNAVLRTEGRVTLIDGVLAVAVLGGLLLNALAGLWWADPTAGYVIVYYGQREARAAFRH